jgi:uncharacterized membrane protein YphA (DoxX/SURF4 family)
MSTNIFDSSRRVLPLAALAGISFTGPAAAHEAWLLSPSEISHLAQSPLPDLFTSPWSIGGAATASILVMSMALRADKGLQAVEARFSARLTGLASELGPVAVRLGLALMLGLAGAGGLPRHGTPLWTEPTLFVPDMQLSLAPGLAGLAAMQVALAVMLATGFLTRIAGLMVMMLALFGLAAFGVPFLDYALHFIAPGLILAIFGGGCLSLDRMIEMEAWMKPPARLAGIAWTATLAIMGGGFVYLGVTCKLIQPTLLMAILEQGEVPLFGLPLDFAALVMTGVEIVAGTLLALGRLTRWIAVFLITAFTFLAITLGENPLFHANLYGVMVMLLLSGRDLPDAGAQPSVAALPHVIRPGLPTIHPATDAGA